MSNRDEKSKMNRRSKRSAATASITASLRLNAWVNTGLFCGLAAIVVYAMFTLSARNQRLHEFHIENEQLLYLDTVVISSVSSLQRILYEDNEQFLSELLTQSGQFQSRYVAYRDAVYARSGFAELSLVEEYEPVVVAIRSGIVKAIALYRNGDHPGAKTVYTDRVARQMNQFSQFTARSMEQLQNAIDQERQSAKSFQRLMMMVVSCAIILFSATAFIMNRKFTRLITTPLTLLMHAAAAIRKGRYDHAVDDVPTEEFGELAEAFNRMRLEIQKRTLKLESEVDERRQAQQQLTQANTSLKQQTDRANEKALQADIANAAKSEFLANMSHEIRTPMNGIVGMTEFLIESDLDEDQLMLAQSVQTCSDQLLALINDILDFSKIEAGKLEMETIDFDLHSVVDQTGDVVAIKTADKGLEFSCYVDPDTPSLLQGDPGRLRQVFINLANNAIKFTEQGEVALAVTVDRETETQTVIRCTVRDTGVGIPADRMDRLFKSFSQVDASTTRKYGGTGLGLTISKKIVEMMNGQIGVESEEGKGSTFWFTAEFGKQAKDRYPSRTQVPAIENLRVLVVDDTETNRYILQRYLKAWGCRSTQVASAQQAMAAMRQAANDNDPFRIALLDWFMPEVDGMTLGKMIKTDPLLRDTSLVMLTSAGQRGEAKQIREIGFEGYLVKPLKQSQLLKCIQTVLKMPADNHETAHRPIVTRHTLDEQRKREVRILLVEDNDMNQKLALRILDLKLGYNAQVAENGELAVNALTREDYDLVLMDCQMPVMDGYEATRTIRDTTSPVRNHDIPIIAMTANALKGEKELCLDAGMDDYVSKPINVQELSNAIERQLTRLSQEHPLPETTPQPLAAALPGTLSAMYEALEHGDCNRLQTLARQFKETGQQYDCPQLARAAETLENAAKNNDIETSRLALNNLSHTATTMCEQNVL